MLIAQPLTPVPPPPFEPRALQGKHAAPETTGGLILPGGPSQTQVDMFSLVLEGGGGGGPFAFGRSRRRDAILTSVCVARLKPTRSRETRQEFARTNYPRKRVAKPFRPRRASCDRIAHAPRPPLSSSGATQFRFAGPSLISATAACGARWPALRLLCGRRSAIGLLRRRRSRSSCTALSASDRRSRRRLPLAVSPNAAL